MKLETIFVPGQTDLSRELKRLALEAGFDLAGVAGVADTPEHRFFPEWIAERRAGEMKYLEALNDAHQLKRASLANAAPWARSVLVCALNYNTDAPYSTHAGGPTQGWISRYAWSQRDYHDVVLEKVRTVEAQLLQLCREQGTSTPTHAKTANERGTQARTWCYVDTGPVLERVFAKYAGIGWIGKNTCVLNERLGSWLFLGVMLTSLELTPDLPPADRCGSCTRCLDACPTNAFPAPYQLDATKCISYLTIELRGSIPEALRPGLGRQVFGCDICQDVCPWNREAPLTNIAEFQPRAQLVNPDLEWLARLTPEEFRETFRGSPLKRAKRSGLLRNVVIAMANSGDEHFIPLVQQLCDDEDSIIAEHARWALRQITNDAEHPQASLQR